MSKHTSLTVSLPESLGDFIQQRVSAGRYPSASVSERSNAATPERLKSGHGR
jgi:hypothetical protein